jgi:peptide/nickel transport system substrate-binding protein
MTGKRDILERIRRRSTPVENALIESLQTSAHPQLHMRTDIGPFADKRVRRALALCLNRKNLVTGLLRGRASLGNDSPFAPVSASTDPTRR